MALNMRKVNTVIILSWTIKQACIQTLEIYSDHLEMCYIVQASTHFHFMAELVSLEGIQLAFKESKCPLYHEVPFWVEGFQGQDGSE